jgi:hypothetical protein
MDLFASDRYTLTNDRGHAGVPLGSGKSRTPPRDIVANSPFVWAQKADEALAGGNDKRAIELVEFAFWAADAADTLM